MVTFSIALAILILGYLIYGKYISKVFGVDPTRPTPVVTKADGVDYVPMPTWKIFMIQFLNIAGLGPIFGAIMGAKFGTASYLWIVFGTIFAGAVHDFVSGMMSLRNDGESLPQMIGRYLGPGVRKIMTAFSLFLLILVGAVFISQPADILAKMTPDSMGIYFWIAIIFCYYLIATLFPIDKIIGRIYPLFAAALLFMGLGIMVMLFVKHPALPEIWTGFGTKYESNPIFPMMFVSIACGAISGFHATQSPMMARCIKNEKYGRPVFYGAMVAEGIIALVWAAATTAYYQINGADQGAGQIAINISKEWLGAVGGFLAILGIVAAPISTGDTALRSARLIVADWLKFDQKTLRSRLAISLPIFAVTAGVLLFSIMNKDGFNIIWRYFAWSNQVLAAFTLWAITVYLAGKQKNFYVSIFPAMFMTFITSYFVLMAPTGTYVAGRGIPALPAGIIAGVFTLTMLFLFIRKFAGKNA